MKTRPRLLAQPKSMRSIIDATQKGDHPVGRPGQTGPETQAPVKQWPNTQLTWSWPSPFQQS